MPRGQVPSPQSKSQVARTTRSALSVWGGPISGLRCSAKPLSSRICVTNYIIYIYYIHEIKSN